ncbi:hypothetical protein B0J13DRAFT_574237 [Dactylonectria estremocensis]|uniref:Uncharacterized protein n=1 Tax=Dactylonectria estremocensis TaxID=1079267 RepID=A0A9P9IA18_9HYPO|nr:hypothetical protein B0J13DRAFT_574237 [Dactylonectria estremocensis]
MVAILSSVARGRPSYQWWLSVVSFLQVAVDCFFGYLPPNLVFLFPPMAGPGLKPSMPDTCSLLLRPLSTSDMARHLFYHPGPPNG